MPFSYFFEIFDKIKLNYVQFYFIACHLLFLKTNKEKEKRKEDEVSFSILHTFPREINKVKKKEEKKKKVFEFFLNVEAKYFYIWTCGPSSTWLKKMFKEKRERDRMKWGDSESYGATLYRHLYSEKAKKKTKNNKKKKILEKVYINTQVGAFLQIRETRLKKNEWYTCMTFEVRGDIFPCRETVIRVNSK